MSASLKTVLMCWLIALLAPAAAAGPYAPAAGKAGSTAIAKDDSAFIDWASDWVDYLPGDHLAETWMDPQKALGAPEGNSFDVVSLGSGGAITLVFDPPMENGPGWDFAIFENSFSDVFLELSYVEVSSDGAHFMRFDTDSLTAGAIGGFGAIDPTNIDGFGGKYRQGFGTPFDLANLSTKDDVLNGRVNLNQIAYVRIIDIIGDGTYTDTGGDVIWDPYPTTQSAGFDLDAVGIRYRNIANSPPARPTLTSPENESQDIDLNPTLASSAFSDENTDKGDYHHQTRWQVSLDSSFATPLIDLYSSLYLTSLILPQTLLSEDVVYYWRVQYFDSYAAGSDWSDAHAFRTTATLKDENQNGLPDAQDLTPDDLADLDQNGQPDVSQIDDRFKILNASDGSGPIAVETIGSGHILEFVESSASDDYPDEAGQSRKPEDFRYGLLSFRLRVPNPGASATLVVYFSEALPDSYQWYKFEPVKGWQIVADAAFSADRRSVTYTLEDGEEGDADGLANGIIVDPVGAGSDNPDAASVPKSGSAGIGGSGGLCWIAALGDSYLIDGLNAMAGPWVLLLFIVLILVRKRFRCLALFSPAPGNETLTDCKKSLPGSE